jgi:cob(I)alamin adenosyltransferase
MGVEMIQSHKAQVYETLTRIRKQVYDLGTSQSYAELHANAEKLINLAQEIQEIAAKAESKRGEQRV